jgi:PAS domain S-box-containing protein
MVQTSPGPRVSSAADASDSDSRYAGLLDALPDAVISADEQGLIIEFNAAAEAIFGYRVEEVLGRPVSILMPPERADELTRIVERVRLGERVEHYETVRQRKDGRRIDVSLTISPIRDVLGRITGSATIARDVTASKRTERELLRSNEELEQFAYVASHDLSEPLRVIAGFTDLLARRYGGRLDEEADRFIGFTISGVERMQAIIDGFLAYSSAGRVALQRVEIDTAALVQEVLGALASSIAEHRTSVEVADLPRVWAEPTLLRQLLQNLIGNAVKFAAEEQPRVRISAMREPERWRFDIADNGPGIDPRDARRVFEMFQRMHGREVPGTGIGLAIAKRIAERHGGRIWVSPAARGGSLFCFTIPDNYELDSWIPRAIPRALSG